MGVEKVSELAQQGKALVALQRDMIRRMAKETRKPERNSKRRKY